MNLNNDSIVRTTYHRFPHPKEAILPTNDKILLNQELVSICSAMPELVYPYGCTLNLEQPAKPLILSGNMCFPANRPIAAVFEQMPKGKIAVVGSSHIFHDAYIDQNGLANGILAESIFSWLLNENLNLYSDEYHEYAEYHQIPDTIATMRPKGILQGGDNSSTAKDLMDSATTRGSGKGDNELFRIDTEYLPKAFEVIERLEVKKEPLSLIPPNFETPLPPLQPAVFPAIFSENFIETQKYC